jgi:hypothetical protein
MPSARARWCPRVSVSAKLWSVEKPDGLGGFFLTQRRGDAEGTKESLFSSAPPRLCVRFSYRHTKLPRSRALACAHHLS